jgi:uncharacterized protein
MKNNQMMIFFLIVFAVYFAANGYIFFKGYNLLPGGRQSVVYVLIYILLASMFIAGKMLERNHSSVLSDIFNIFGGFWLAYMLYTFILYLITDIGFLAGRATGLITQADIPGFRQWRFLAVNVVTVLVVMAGFINALSPVVKRYEVSVKKELSGIGELNIVAVSDIHLGSTIRKRSMRKLQGIIGSLKPDLVVLLGDIVDGEIGPVLRGDLLASFNCPPCRDGVLAITGNHEYIGGIDKTATYIRSKGIRLLEDEVVKTASGVTVIGRKDRDSFRYTGIARTDLKELISQADTTSPIILLDHQPYNLSESSAAGVDLHLSGHTHNGQIWPISMLISRIYELPYGFLKSGTTSYIVSSGFGLWGPRVRIGSRPEIVLIKMKFIS